MSISPSMLIPRPLRDLVTLPPLIANFGNIFRNQQSDSAGSVLFVMFGGGFISRPMAKMFIKAALRTAVAALAVLTIPVLSSFTPTLDAFTSILNGPLPIALTLGSLISLPITLIIAGSGLAYFGVTAVVASVASNSFISLGLGLVALSAGWLMLEYHDVTPFGIAELLVFDPIAEELTIPLLKLFS